MVLISFSQQRGSIAARLQPASLRKIITVSDLADLLDGVSAEDVAARQGTGTWVAQVLSAALARRAMVAARQTGVDITDPIGQPRPVLERMAREIESALQVIVPVLRGPSVE